MDVRRWGAPLLAAGLLLTAAPQAFADAADDAYSGSDLWLHYTKVADPALLDAYRAAAAAIVVDNAGATPVFRHTSDLHMEPGAKEKLEDTTLGAAKDELSRGLNALLDETVPVQADSTTGLPNGAVIVGTRASSPAVAKYLTAADLASAGTEGYVIRTVTDGAKTFTVIAGNTDVAALYGTYAFLRLIQTDKPVADLAISSTPKVKHRDLDYWETTRLYSGNNANGTGGLNGENGAVFDFTATGASAAKNLPVILDRYLVVARAMASLGLNGITINNVNADNRYLTPAAIEQEAALADALRPYGIKLSLSINYGAPTDARFAPDVLTAAQMDPTSADFRGWWSRKATAIHAAIPDFTGFTVKASSEGQPGPEMFGYDQGDGANGLAAALAPLGMKVFWRTFVYDAGIDEDRLKRAYKTFGYINDAHRFASNVLLQTKNGPLDYQAREPFNPMFGRMDNTSQALELEVTQEYTGQNVMLAYLGPMWEEALKSDTYVTERAGTLLPKRLMGNIVDGSAQGQPDTAMVGVANLGNADDLVGNHFSAANLYAFGRLAWDWTQSSKDIAEEWTRMTWGNDATVVKTVVQMMMGSREAVASYQTPLGIAHQMGMNVHYAPGPSEWVNQDDQSPVYFNKADSVGLGYDRSRTGSDFVDQYFPTVATAFNDIATTPDNLLMWFHHVPWGYTMKDGQPFWDELVYRYQMGVQYVTWERQAWDSLQPLIGARRFSEVKAKLAQNETDASSWRDVSVAYWDEFSKRPIPTDHGALSARIVVAGKTIGGFNLSSSAYTIPVHSGDSPTITGVLPADPAATYTIVSQAAAVPGTAVVKVTKDDFFGPLVKNYTFNFVADTTLRSLKVDGTEIVKPDTLSYDAVMKTAPDTVPTVQAAAADPAATVTVNQASTPTGAATVVVGSGGASTTYTVNLDTENGGDDFNGAALDPKWRIVRPDPAKLSVGGGALHIASQAGDLQGTANTAKNVALEDVNGDWTAESKLVFSRKLATNNEQGGIVAYRDDQNYVKVAWEMASSTQPINRLHVVLLREQNGTATTAAQVTGNDAQSIVGADGAIWLRIAKSGSTYKAYYSNDGSVWRYFGTTTLNVDTPKAGMVAFNRAGTSTDLDVAFDSFHVTSAGDPVPSAFTQTDGGVGATVPATLSLTLGAAPSFGTFTPGVDRTYSASTTANVISTAGDAALSVSDPGHLSNGAFSLPEALQVTPSKSSWAAPVSNDAVTIGFSQHIGATDALRTGSYSRTLTFTLATTMP
jgi:alpha-glucuronidase